MTGGSRIGRRAFLLAGVATAALTACGALPTSDDEAMDDIDATIAPDDGEPLRVAVVGDSITFMSTEHIRAGLTSLGLEVVTIDAQVGRRMTVGAGGQLYPGTDVISFIAAGDGVDVWVVALGTNDVGQYADAAAYTEQVLDVLATVPDDAPLVWVDTWHRDRLADCELLNGVLRSVVGARPRAVVVDWYSYGDDDGVVTRDGVHPTEAGTAVFGAVVTAGVRDLLSSS